MIHTHFNHKQHELIQGLFAAVQAKYPSIHIKGYERNPDDKEHIWVIVEAAMDEDEEIALRHYAASLSADILFDYGYCISIMTDNPMAIA
jgi:GTP cyclohydrolase II